ncbi:MAG: GNAT family N-acetyltransferase [Verrucomicrobia bacterium]|nr:GNAT family N-acetyltransferase [Verrucomicrobiota bacterium]
MPGRPSPSSRARRTPSEPAGAPARSPEDEWQLELLPYPLAPKVQQELVRLLRTEWTRTDYDWIEAMNGDYSEHLAITSVIARRAREPLATATIHFPRHHAEVAVIGGVLTHRDHRDRGLASRMLELLLARAEAAGCKVCLLGTARSPHNVYKKHGFAWHNGRVMRRGFGSGDLEPRYFAADQTASCRDAHWGDLPGVTLLAAQPLTTLGLDFPRGLFSSRFHPAERCLSNFPVLWYDTVTRGGAMLVLAHPGNGRVFGFGTLTVAPGAVRRHTATVDFTAHDHYLAHLPALLRHLLAAGRTRHVHRFEAWVLAKDGAKLQALQDAGFTEVARRREQVRGARGACDVLLLECAI